MKRLLCIILTGVMVLASVGCGSKTKEQKSVETTAAETEETKAEETEAEATEETKTGTHVIVDHLGIEVEVPYEVNRIAVGNILPLPSVLTVFFDSAEKIVGMSPNSMSAAENGLLGELYPDILKAETGYMNGTDINLEELMKLEPDIVLYSASQPEQGEQLRNAGFAAVALSVNKWEYNAIETLNQWIGLLSEIFPDNDKTEVVAKHSDEIYNMVQERVADIPEEERERVFFLFKYSDTDMETSGSKFFGQFWADAVGAVNVAEEITTDNQVAANMEQVYKWNPTIIFITNFTAAQPDDLYNNTIGNYDWSAVDAVKNQKVYKMPLGMYRSYTPGADTPVTLLWFAKNTYPELFEDIDMIQETKDYYKEVFGVELTDDQASAIFEPNAEAGSGF
ncbi:MAG: ABC transporter substrate-binding protein [Firmicutes bacterium]|nr:ABC transporter substrate-binding protein [Blautia sp.]MDD7371422.1 ABC transporter substrate-binding protein [Bacillota bacterium]MDY3715497.1 ABC transporter substrate-binding protein [Blautia sp.]